MKDSGAVTDSSSPATGITDVLSNFSLEEDELSTARTMQFFGHMVTIHIGKVSYPIPRMLLVRSSAYFAELIPDGQNDVRLDDPDVSSAAFESFLVVLSSPLGASSSLTLSTWVDVLHLSSKWEITVMRAAAIAAISPLLSSMDELVFGRLYDVELWVLDALVGILGRKEDLSIEEARRMQLEDVVAIAKGRRDAQMLGGTSTLDHDVLIQLVAALYPQEFGHLLQVVTNSSPPPSMPAGEQLLAEASVEDTGAAPDPDAIPSQERMADLRRWIGFVADPTATEHYVSRACLIKYTDKHPAQRPTIFDLLMQQGLQRFKQSEGKYFAKNLNAVVQAFDFLKLKCKWEEGLFEELVQAAALRLVDHWDILTSESLTETPAAVSLSSIVLPIFDATRFVRHLVDKKVVPIAIFCMFWAKLLVLFETSIQQTPSQCPHVVRAVLEKTEGHVFTNAACLEIDTFYEMVDSAQARIRTQWAVTADLLQNKIIKERKWPTDFSD